MSDSHACRGDTFLARGHSSGYPTGLRSEPSIENKVTQAIRGILEEQELLSQRRLDEAGLEGVAYILPDGNGAGFYFESVYMPIPKVPIARDILETKGEILTCRDVALLTLIVYGAFLKVKNIDHAVAIRFNEQGELACGSYCKRGFCYDEPHFWIDPQARVRTSFKGLKTYEGDDFSPIFERMVKIYKKIIKCS